MAVSSCSPPNSSGGSRGGGSGLDRVNLLAACSAGRKRSWIIYWFTIIYEQGWRWEETAASSWAPILLGLKHVGLLGIAFGWQRSFVVSLSGLAKPGRAVLVLPRLSCFCFVKGRQIASPPEQFLAAVLPCPKKCSTNLQSNYLLCLFPRSSRFG